MVSSPGRQITDSNDKFRRPFLDDISCFTPSWTASGLPRTHCNWATPSRMRGAHSSNSGTSRDKHEKESERVSQQYVSGAFTLYAFRRELRFCGEEIVGQRFTFPANMNPHVPIAGENPACHRQNSLRHTQIIPIAGPG